jgi:ABC-type nickel/cobalt efflux system permease component RcnA
MKTKLLIVIFLFVLSGTLLANPFTATKKTTLIAAPAGNYLSPKMIQVQGDLKTKLANALHRIEEGEGSPHWGTEGRSAYFTLLLLAFVYGVFHAVGPGHRKAVVFGAFLARRAKFWEPGFAGLLLAVLHVLASILLVYGVQFAAGRIIGSRVDQTSGVVDFVTLLVLLFFIGYLLIDKFRKLYRGEHSAAEMTAKNIYITMAISGLIPCPGATLILIFAASLGLYFTGILAVAAMSLGMGITISLAGYLAYFGQEALFRRLQNTKQAIGRLSTLLEIAGLLFVLLFCLFLLLPGLVGLFN